MSKSNYIYIFLLLILNEFKWSLSCKCTNISSPGGYICECIGDSFDGRTANIPNDNQTITHLLLRSSNFSNSFLIDNNKNIQSVEFVDCIFGIVPQGAMNSYVKNLAVIRANKFELRPLKLKNSLISFSLLDLETYPSSEEMMEFFQNNSNLTKLNINKMDLSKIDNTFFNSLNLLSHLNLSKTKVNLSSLSSLHNLESIHLINNNITELPMDFLDGSKDKLKELNLTKNSLEKLNEFNFKKFIKLENLTLPYTVHSCSWLKEHDKLSKDVNCSDVEHSEHHSSSSNKALLIIAIIIFSIVLLLALFCLVRKVCLNRRTRSSQDPKTARYSAVYRTTVEPTNPSA